MIAYHTTQACQRDLYRIETGDDKQYCYRGGLPPFRILNNQCSWIGELTSLSLPALLRGGFWFCWFCSSLGESKLLLAEEEDLLVSDTNFSDIAGSELFLWVISFNFCGAFFTAEMGKLEVLINNPLPLLSCLEWCWRFSCASFSNLCRFSALYLSASSLRLRASSVMACLSRASTTSFLRDSLDPTAIQIPPEMLQEREKHSTIVVRIFLYQWW